MIAPDTPGLRPTHKNEGAQPKDQTPKRKKASTRTARESTPRGDFRQEPPQGWKAGVTYPRFSNSFLRSTKTAFSGSIARLLSIAAMASLRLLFIA